ncbi:hypothetical protein D3C87_182510 [compost metagenome]
MIKWFKLTVVYGIVFLVGYLGTGITLHYVKPEVKILPQFVENILDGGAIWKVQYPATADVSMFDIRTYNPQGHDPEEEILFTDDYNSKNGIFCFRGNAQRNAPTRGLLKGKPSDIRLDWEFITGYDGTTTSYGSWGGGSGWTGQPLVVKWPEKIRKRLHGIEPVYLNQANFREVIVGSLCGDIYFLDWKTGKATRPHVTIENPIKGTVSVDPRMNGLLYVGQGIPNGTRFGSYIFNLFTGEEIFFRNGLDPKARRAWGAFDSNSLIDVKTGYWFHPGENGQIYKTKVVKGKEIPDPFIFNYRIQKHPDLGIESSFGAWNNLGWFGDNGGNVFCMNLMTMIPVWYLDNYDDTDASMVIDLQEEGHPFLYTGNEVDKQGESGIAHIRKIDGLTGEEIWDVTRKSTNTKLHGRVNSGGVLSSVLPGKKKANNLVYGIFSRVNGTLAGEFVAIDKTSGKEKFVIKMDHYSWASPIDLYDKAGNCYLFFTDVYGTIYLIDGLSGKIIVKRKTEYVWESSPVAWGNRIVVGSRGKKIVSFVID